MRLARAMLAVTLGLSLLVAGTTAATAASTTYYVSVGDSLAAGYMPGQGNTSQGYADDVAATLRSGDPGLQLVKLGCSGETTTTLVDGGICHYDRGSQLKQAEAFLAAHRGSTAYLSLDIGANDVSVCARTGTVNLPCIVSAVTTVVQNLATILAGLRQADPMVRAVGLTYYDPYLAAALLGDQGKVFATQSLELSQALNVVETGLYGAYGFRVADVATAFDSTDTSAGGTVAGFGPQPVNVATICRYTYMCTQRDIHPNADGYRLIGTVVSAELR